MTSRIQIAFDPETQQRARKRATNLGVSFAEYIRRLVAKDLDTPERFANPSAVFNLGNSGDTDIARSKAVLLGKAAEEICWKHERTR